MNPERKILLVIDKAETLDSLLSVTLANRYKKLPFVPSYTAYTRPKQGQLEQEVQEGTIPAGIRLSLNHGLFEELNPAQQAILSVCQAHFDHLDRLDYDFGLPQITAMDILFAAFTRFVGSGVLLSAFENQIDDFEKKFGHKPVHVVYPGIWQAYSTFAKSINRLQQSEEVPVTMPGQSLPKARKINGSPGRVVRSQNNLSYSFFIRDGDDLARFIDTRLAYSNSPSAQVILRPSENEGQCVALSNPNFPSELNSHRLNPVTVFEYSRSHQ